MHDLIDCPAAGILVNASDVTIRLKGHIIDGADQAQPGGIAAGVGVPGGRHNVSIMGPGEIREFFWAIAFEDVQQGIISDVTMDQNTFADTVRNNVVIGNGNEGIRADNLSPQSIGHVITGNTARNNGGAGDLVDLWGDCAHNRWFANTFGTKNPACIQ